MAIELITGYAGTGHVSSADAGRLNAGICGTGKYVLKTGQKFAYTIESNNLIKIASGDAVNQGRHICIPQNSVENANIQNGTQNKTRIDVIALRYSKNTNTGTESAELIVIKGSEVTIGSSPVAPAGASGNIFAGAATDDMPLYHVKIEGTNITSVTKAFEEIPNLSNIADEIYPVGSIYMSVNNVNPGTLFGGTWQEIQDRFLLGRSSSRPAGQTGGNESIQLTEGQLPSHKHTGPSHSHSIPEHTHKASTNKAGEHTHTLYRTKNAATGTAKYSVSGSAGTASSKAGSHEHSVTIVAAEQSATGSAGTGNTGSTGSGETINIMPPYISVHIWKRTS